MNDAITSSCGTITEEHQLYLLECKGLGNIVELNKDGVATHQNIAEIEVFGQYKPGYS